MKSQLFVFIALAGFATVGLISACTMYDEQAFGQPGIEAANDVNDVKSPAESVSDEPISVDKGSCSAQCQDGTTATVSCNGTCVIQNQECTSGIQGSASCLDTGAVATCNSCLIIIPCECPENSCGFQYDNCGELRFCGECDTWCTRKPCERDQECGPGSGFCDVDGMCVCP